MVKIFKFKTNIIKILRVDLWGERFPNSNITFLRISYKNKVNVISNIITSLFQILWESELRSSNFNVKVYNFFSKWHDSLMRLSFYDFLKKTKLLQDERDFCRNYKKNILKRHEAEKRLETLKYFSLWEKYDLIDGLDDRLKPKGYLKKKKNGTN